VARGSQEGRAARDVRSQDIYVQLKRKQKAVARFEELQCLKALDASGLCADRKEKEARMPRSEKVTVLLGGDHHPYPPKSGSMNVCNEEKTRKGWISQSQTEVRTSAS
jgi:hypothetical protein